jgi:hypothetical protein
MDWIGILRWSVELGRIDIMVEVAMLSHHLALPRTGHLEQALHVFLYMNKYARSTMVFDDMFPDFDEARFQKCNWADFYPEAAEAILDSAPEPRGKSVVMSCVEDASHGSCMRTRRSQTGVLVYFN